MTTGSNNSQIRIAELFAGVGGFRVGFDSANKVLGDDVFKTVWANQWEPGSERKQFAWRCYESHFGKGSCVNEDIHLVMSEAKVGERDIPDFDLLVGGFPCQDYSVAKSLSTAYGIEGKKGVLWWDIHDMLQLKKPRFVLLENVDRLLKSPAAQRGRDFAIILSCLCKLGYSVEWHVINAAEYGMPQKRRRVYIFAELDADTWDLSDRLFHTGVLAQAFPIDDGTNASGFKISNDPYKMTQKFGLDTKISAFQLDGVMQNGNVLTTKGVAAYDGPRRTLGDCLIPDGKIPAEFFVDEDQIEKWAYLKGSKSIERVTSTGHRWTYSEGAMAFPDLRENPARTILTGEGGKTPSRFKHIVQCSDGRFRRLVPDELDQLQCFPQGWTHSDMTDGQRAFCMGNALVTEIPQRVALELAKRI